MISDLISFSPDAVCFLFVYSCFQISIAVFIMQAAQEWLGILSWIASFESGMGSSVTAVPIPMAQLAGCQ